MDTASLLVDQRRSLVRAPLGAALNERTGSPSVAVLATLFDIGASDPALAACRPDWTATQNLSLHTVRALEVGPIVVDSYLMRVGKKVVIVRADVYDGQGVTDFQELVKAIDRLPAADSGGGPTVAATGLLAFARLPGSAAAHDGKYNPSGWVGVERHNPTPTAPVGPLFERLGLEVLDARTGRVRLALTPYVANSIGTINGGAQALMAEAAAEVMRPGLVAVDLQIHYLSQLKGDAAVTAGRVVRDGRDQSVVGVELFDTDPDGDLMASAVVTLQDVAGSNRGRS
jgi:acyl-coenzyme A thioesterase PaaI-like protein